MRRISRPLTLCLALALGGHAAFAADNWVVKDYQGNNVTLRSKDTGTGQAQFHVLADGTGAAYSSSNPVFVQLNAGSAAIGSVSVSALPTLPAGTNNIGSISSITGTVTLPTGAATAAKQPALGLAGTPSADVLSVQGVVGGLAFPVTQSGAWTVALGASALTIGSVNVLGGNATAVKVDGSAVTQPVTATALPLPTGAATAALQTASNTALTAIQTAVTTPALPSGASTAAKQPALGVAGTPSADVISIQGVVGGVAQSITATALPLPTGAATAAAQTSGNTSLASLDSKAPALVAGRTPVDGSAVTQPVSATALPLPTGAATAALQTTGNAALTTLNTTLTARLPLDTNNVLKTVLYDSTGAAVTYGGTTVIQGVVGGVAVPVSGAVSQAGSVGTDASANAPAVPNVGAVFGGTGPYAGYVLIKSIPAAPTRLNVEVQNTSGGPIVIVRDDGVAASGAAPANATLIPLSGGQSAGQQGGTWSSATFKGRLQIYAPTAGVFVSAAID